MHRAEEDCIKNIYKLTIEKGESIVKNNLLAQSLMLTDQSVNEMVKRLSSKKMVTFIPYKGVSLTKKGLNEAVRLVRNHRLWEVFLVDKLNYSWSDVHDEAEKLEHASSPELMEKINIFLDKPKYCVHGNIIPSLDKTQLLSSKHISIKDANVNSSFIIKRVLDQADLLSFLDKKNLFIDKCITISNKDDLNKIITIKDGEHEVFVSFAIADMIYGIIK